MEPYQRRNLIDTRRRHQPSPQRWDRRDRRPPPSPSPSDAANDDMDLRRIFMEHRIPWPIFNSVQERFMDLTAQASKTTRLAGELNAANRRVKSLQSDQKDLKSQLDTSEKDAVRRESLVQSLTAEKEALKLEKKTLVDEKIALNKEKNELDDFVATQNQLIDIGTNALRDQRMKVTSLQRENEKVNKSVKAHKAAEEHLREMVSCMRDASENDFTNRALEAQAKQTLSMVQGLKAAVSEKQSAFEDLGRQYDRETKRLRSLLAERDHKLAEAERRNEDQARRIAQVEAKAAVTNQRAVEATAISEEQGKLIEKLMKNL